MVLIGYEHYLPGGTFCGASFFTNSFGQPTVYAFVGKEWTPFAGALPRWSVAVSGGLSYGYVGAHKRDVPIDVGGFAPLLIPDIAYRFRKADKFELYLLSTAGLMFGYSHRF